jgi:phage terminase small subunit
MPELKNPRWEKFARLFVELGNASEAYRRAGYAKDNADVCAHKLMVITGVKARISDLRASELFKMSMKREELEGFFSAAIKTPAGEVTPAHPLCQSYKTGKSGVEVRMPDKVAAATALARLAGWDVQRVEVTANPLTDYLRSLRSAEVHELPDSDTPHSH